jgi:hypothetical protein
MYIFYASQWKITEIRLLVLYVHPTFHINNSRIFELIFYDIWYYDVNYFPPLPPVQSSLF